MTLDDWLAVYEQDPLDFGVLLPFADWCREQGDERAAACLLWCHRHERAPDYSRLVERDWIWWNAGQYTRSGLATPGDLPNVLWHRLQQPTRTAILKRYQAARVALRDLLVVWQQHPLLPCGHPPCCLTDTAEDLPNRDPTLSTWCHLCAWTPAEVTA
jgi:hypothetical protein